MRDLQKKAAYLYYYSGGGAPALPTDFDGLQFWFDASQEVDLENDEAILQLQDFSGNNHYLSVASGTAQPLFKTNVLNGLPGIKFDGLNDVLGTGASGPENYYFLHNGPNTLFILLNITDTETGQVFLDSSSSNVANTTVGRHIRLQPVNGRLILEDRIMNGLGPDNYVVNFQSGAGSEFLAQPYLLCIIFDPNAAEGDKYRVYRDNILLGSVATVGVPSVAASAATPAWGRNNTNTQRFSGHLIEWFGFNRVLTTSEIQSLTGGIGYTP